MKGLIEKLEAAMEGSRELDAEILAALGTHVLEKRGRDKKRWWYPVESNDQYDRLDPEAWGSGYRKVPSFTTSLDAALTLVPAQSADQAVFWRVGNDGEGGNPADFKAEIYVAGIAAGKSFTAVAETAPLALLAAALKARCAQ